MIYVKVCDVLATLLWLLKQYFKCINADGLFIQVKV